jgi:hypothetical protein
MPCDEKLLTGDVSPLAQPLRVGELCAGNRFAVHPMEGEAVAVRQERRANPNQLLFGTHAAEDLARLPPVR